MTGHGIPLQYIGIAYMACISLLAFGTLIFLLFGFNFGWVRKGPSLFSMIPVFILLSIFFEGSVPPSYAGESFVHVFGRGKINVRFYTDYFCPPCRAMEPDVAPIIRELVEQDKINITFIDTPFYQHSSLYARYYLYAMGSRREIEHALATRAVLIETAKQNIGDPARIEALLTDKGIIVKPFDTKPVFDLYSRALKEDGINSTPTCVIENNGKKEKIVGGANIVGALKNLR